MKFHEIYHAVLPELSAGALDGLEASGGEGSTRWRADTKNPFADEASQYPGTFLNAKKFTEAIEVLKLNVETFPRSANTYDSLAEAYLNSGDKENALKHYEMALQKA